MSYTEKDMERQFAEFQAIKEEFSRLTELNDSLLKKSGFSVEDIKFDFGNLSKEEDALVAIAKKEAEESATNPHVKTASSSASTRKNIVRG